MTNTQCNTAVKAAERRLTCVQIVLDTIFTASPQKTISGAVAEECHLPGPDFSKLRARCLDELWQVLFVLRVAYKRLLSEKIRCAIDAGLEPPDPVPHPDDMVIRRKRMEVTINGPANMEEKAEWDQAEFWRCEELENVDFLKELLAGSDEQIRTGLDATRKEAEMALAETIEKLDLLDAFYPAPDIRRRARFNLEAWRKKKSKGRDCPTWTEAVALAQS